MAGARPTWAVLDTHFGQGQAFLAAWHAWRTNALRPRMLHYVGILGIPEADTWGASPLDRSNAHPELEPLAQQLADCCWGLLPGFHRVLLDEGQVSLTLCVGPLKEMLLTQQFVADVVRCSPHESEWDAWTAKALAHCCKRGTQLHIEPRANALPPSLAQDLQHAGFVLEPASTAPLHLRAAYNPGWTLRKPSPTPALSGGPARCAVIGAGLAGASVAHSLARRGWQVTVLDCAPHPAAGASGLPVGLLTHLVSSGDDGACRMSRAGMRLMLQHAQTLLQAGQDWSPSGVMQLRADAKPVALAPPHTAGHAWLQDGAPHMASAQWAHGCDKARQPVWHPRAAWIKPAAIVRAWLQHPNITFQGCHTVQSLHQGATGWQLLGTNGQCLAEAEVVVVANAMACTQLLGTATTEALQNLQAVHGAVSHGHISGSTMSPHLPAWPVNGNGHFLGMNSQWFAGATFETATLQLDTTAAHQHNLQRLQTLLPTVADLLQPQFDVGHVDQWRGTRCVTHDRLALVGRYDASTPSLWLSVGMGARGLAFAALCAELIAAQIGAEPWPMESRLARSLDLHR